MHQRSFDPEAADQKVEDFVKYQNQLYETMKAQKKTEKEINTRFKQEFWKLCQKLEK